MHKADETARVCCGSLQIPSQYATGGIELWTGSKAKIVKLPEDIKGSLLFKLPLYLPMDSQLSIKTYQTSDIYLCSSTKNSPWNEKQLTSAPYLFEKNRNLKLFTTNENLDIYHRRITEDTACRNIIDLPTPQQNATTAVVFIKEISERRGYIDRI